MIKEQTILPIIQKPKSKNRQNSKADAENLKPLAFNTKGYYDPNSPLNQDYLTLKQKVFEKYRNVADEEIIMIDINNLNKSAFIQRGCLLPIKQNNNSKNDQGNIWKNNQRINLLRNYLSRKQKRINIQSEKYNQRAKISVEMLQSHISDTTKKNCPNKISNISSRIVSEATNLKSQYEF